MSEKSNKPFPAALDDLLNEAGWSNRQLSEATRKRFKWGSHGTVNLLVNGDMPPSRKAMELIAAVLGVPPSHFAEYRLLRARDHLDPAQVGLEEALRNLSENPRLSR